MPLPIYSVHSDNPDYRKANILYDEAMSIVDRGDKATAIDRLIKVQQLLQSCNEEGGRRMVEDKIKELRG